MDVLTGIKNVLEYINDNWTAIIIILGLVIAIAKKAKDFLSKTDDERIAVVKKQIKEIVLTLVTEAEMEYKNWVKSGAIKRAQVIEEIFLMYPILAKVTNQEELIAWIDEIIDDALKIMREIFAEQVVNND